YAPRPGVAEPKRRKHGHRAGPGPPVLERDRDRHISAGILGILTEKTKITSAIKDPGASSLKLNSLPPPTRVPADELPLGCGSLGVLVQVPHVRVRRRRVEVEVVFLHVLAVVAFAVGETEQPLLDDGILAVPQRQCEAKELLIIRDSSKAVLAPAIGTGTCLVVAEVVPRIAVGAVVLAHRSPLTLAQVGSPSFPGDSAAPRFFKSDMLGCHGAHGRSTNSTSC